VGIRSGKLLGLGEGQLNVFVTIDANLRHQQNLSGRLIAVIVLNSSSNRLENLRPYFAECLSALDGIQPGQIGQMGILRQRVKTPLRAGAPRASLSEQKANYWRLGR
jgi:hypothetical protein